MRLAVLASGSKGNALLVEHSGTRLLVDCGLSPKRLRKRLKEVGRELADLHGIVLTHSHGDHASGAARVAGPFRLRVYATRATRDATARRGGLPNFVPVDPGVDFELGSISLKAFDVPHDAAGAVGYVLEADGERLGICTDIGHPTTEAALALRGLDALYLEFNHDKRMLQEGPYTPFLKRRVAGDLGHLSNEQAAELLERAYTPRLKQVLLAHLSEVNNTPSLAIKAAKRVLRGTGVRLQVAPQHHSLSFIDVVPEDECVARARTPGGGVERPPKPEPAPEAPRPERKGHMSIAVERQLELFMGGGAPRRKR
jgi:phosphoribosyl 1,2-cyclic phosphodiesterase